MALISKDYFIFLQALNEIKPVNIGYVKIPKKYLPSEEKPRIVNLEVDFENLQNILKVLTEK